MSRGRTIIGVDFGANKKSGDNTWISEGELEDGVLKIDNCQSAENKFCFRKRDDVLNCLVEMVKESSPSVVGFDFPFGLPRDVVRQTDWHSFIKSFDFPSPDALNTHYKQRADGSHKLRRTEERTGGQCAYGYRIRHQTYYGIKSVLQPLLKTEDVDFPPMIDEGQPTSVIETYPAAVLEHIGADRVGYKKQRMMAHDTRWNNVNELNKRIEFDDKTSRYAAADENALDSLLAAYAASEALLSEFDVKSGEYDETEGYLYAARP